MKKNLLIFYVAPQVEEFAYAENAVLCASGDVSGENESFTEGDEYVW